MLSNASLGRLRAIATSILTTIVFGSINAPAFSQPPAPPAITETLTQPTPDDRQPGTQPFSRLQSDLPPELLAPAVSPQAKSAEQRFVHGTIEPELPLNLLIGRPKVIQLAAIPKRVYVPFEDVVQVEVVDEKHGKDFAITGLQVGTGTLIFWFDDPQSPTGETSVSYLVRVYDDPILVRPIEDLAQQLNEKFPNSWIELDQIEDRLIVRGQTPDVTEMSQILQVLVGARGVRAGVGRPAMPVTASAAFDFAGDLDPLAAEEAAAERRRVIDPIALAQAGIINQLKVVGEQQVMLKVTVAEVNRSAARSIGLNALVDNDAGLTVFQSLAGNLTQTGGAATQSSANILTSLDMGQVSLAIEALRQLNLSRTLAEPNLVASNGEPADFQAGGRFPVPIISSGGNGAGQNLQGVAFVPFGVQLRFTPIIQDRDVIRLQLNAEVSTRDESLGTAIGGAGGGTQVTGLNSRNFATTIQMRSGQTIAVAGLLQTNYGGSTDRAPFFGDLPILGPLSGINRSSSGEQELIILVTPHLVAPLSGHEGPALPGSDVHEPTDIEFYLSNRLESRRNQDFRASVRTDLARQRRAENCCPERFMIGSVGPTDRCLPNPVASRHQPVAPLGEQNSIHVLDDLSSEGLQ